MPPLKVLHILYQSLPHLWGTSIRSRDILLSQKNAGIEVVAVTSPFQKPFELSKSKDVEYYQEIPYYRTYNNEGINFTEGISTFATKIRKLSYFLPFTYRLYKIIKKEKPDVLHAHATFFTAISAKICSVIFNIPFIYEVRSLWDERQKQLSKTKWQLFQVSLIRKTEQFAFNMADEVVVINKNLENELRKRGVRKPITVITNAISLNKIDETVDSKKTSTQGKIVFGYVGSLTFIEGLPFLLRQFSLLRNMPIELLIFGDGPIKAELEKIIEKENINNVSLKGSFNPQETALVYKQIDCIINPRIKNTLSDSVTPIKPLEALAYRKLFIGSDVGGIKELIKNRETGILFKAENAESFKEAINFIIKPEHSEILNTIIHKGYLDVKSNFNWEINALKYKLIYENLITEYHTD